MNGFVPSAIIFVNNDITNNIRDHLVTQLFIDGYMSGTTYNSLIDGYIDGYIPDNIYTTTHSLNKRLLVIMPFDTIKYREYADIIIFCKHGLASVELNKLGPHDITYPIINLTLEKLGLFKSFND